MPLPQVTFIEGQGGLGRALPSFDHISALVFYNVSTLPSGFSNASTATRCKAIYSTDDAIAAGILRDYSDATSAVGIYTITGAGAAGDTIELRVADIVTATGAVQSTSLGVYTRTSAATTVTLVAADYVATINAGTSVHGYSATNTAGAISITAPKRLGAYLNSLTSISATIVGTMTGTITQQFGTGTGGATAGVASNLAVWYYHISEFFRLNPNGKLWVGFFGTPASYTFSELTDMQNLAGGEIRQFGVYKNAVWAQADTTALQAICTANKAIAQPCVALYTANLQATTDITTISDMSSLSNNQVLSCIAQDGSGWGNFLYKTFGTAGLKTIGSVGAVLGETSSRKVSENIGWVQFGNLSNGVEYAAPAFANGQLVSVLSNSALQALDGKRHVFVRTFPNYSGAYFNNSHMCVAANSDYAYLENNRVMQKMQRLLYAALMPYLNSPLLLNSNGTLSDITVATFETIGSAALDQMIRDQEMSAKKVTVNPAQNVLSTNKLQVAVQAVINGVAMNIEIPIGFKPSIA